MKFAPIDPLAGGLGEDIDAERREPEAIDFSVDEEANIQQFWQEVDVDIHAGGGVNFSDD